MINLTINNFESAAELHNYFAQYGRGDNFTPAQMEAIYNLFKEVAPDNVIDVIEICCDFTGYSNILKAMEDFGYDDPVEFENDHIVCYAENGEVVVQD